MNECDAGIDIRELLELWHRAFGDTGLPLKRMMRLITNRKDNPEASKNTRRLFRQYLQDAGILSYASPRTKLGLYLSRHIGRHGDYELSRVKNEHLHAWQWSVRKIEPEPAPEPPPPEPAKTFCLVPHGSSRFSHEPSAERHAQRAQSLGINAAAIFYQGCGHAVRLHDVDQREAEQAARKLGLKLVTSADAAEQTRTQSMEYHPTRDTYTPAGGGLGYIPEEKFIRRAMGLGEFRGSPAIPVQPMSSWSPFSDVPNCIRRRGSYANADAHESYARASRNLTTYLNGKKR